MSQSTVNQVRQILMNELGLSRDYVREQVDAIVRETIRKHLSSQQFNNLVQREVKAAIEAALKESYYDKEKLKAHAIGAIKTQVAKQLENDYEVILRKK